MKDGENSWRPRMPKRAVWVTLGMSLIVAGSTPTRADDERVIGTELLQALRASGSCNLYVHFAAQADLDAINAQAMGWEERGRRVQEALAATAASSQAEAIKLLKAAGLKYTSFISGNSLYVEQADLGIAQALSRLPGVTSLTLPKTYRLHSPANGHHQP